MTADEAKVLAREVLDCKTSSHVGAAKLLSEYVLQTQAEPDVAVCIAEWIREGADGPLLGDTRDRMQVRVCHLLADEIVQRFGKVRA
jgi:hypothetical protein